MTPSAPAAQRDLFTGALPGQDPFTPWLFDPDFGVPTADPVPLAAGIEAAPGVLVRWPADVLVPPPLRRPPLPARENPRAGPRPPADLRPVASPGGAQVVISAAGVFLGKRGERLQIKIGGKTIAAADGEPLEFPFLRLSEVIVAARGVSLSSDLVRELCARGVRLTFIEPSGRPYAQLSSPTLTATVESRRAQLAAFADERGLLFARSVVRGKIRNQRHLLQYSAKYLKTADPARNAAVAALVAALRRLELAARAVSGPNIGERRRELLGLEGAAARLYWRGFTAVLGQTEFPGRDHRGAADAVNALLNYGYGILYAQTWGALVNAGLEPFAGFLHVDRPGKPSLVLDLVEEFRQPVVDRAVIAHLNLGQPASLADGLLDEPSRRAFAARVVERLESPEPFRGRKYQLRSILQMQARSLASFFRGRAVYRPFSFRW